MIVEIHHAPCRFASLWSAFGRRCTGPATTPCSPTRTTQPFSSGCGGTSRPKLMGVAGMKDVLEREERAYVLFARRARTSRQPRARPCGLLRRGRGPQISLGRGAVPAHISGQQRSGSIGPTEAQRVADAVIAVSSEAPERGAQSEAHARVGKIRSILSEHCFRVRVSCAARGSASGMESAFA